MLGLDKTETLFVIWAFVVQICLIVLFAIRKMDLDFIVKYGWIFYLLSIPAVVVSIIMLSSGKGFSFWIGGFLFLAWAIFGYVVEYRLGIKWRNPAVLSILIPYVLLYLSTIMFYWFPLGNLAKPLWYVYGALFALGTYLNITSH